MHLWRGWMQNYARRTGQEGRRLAAALRWLGMLSLRQWNSQTSIRSRRLVNVAEMYKQLYQESTFRGLFGSLTLRFLRLRPPSSNARKFLLAAVAFCYRENGVSDEEISRTQSMISEIDNRSSVEDANGNNNGVNGVGPQKSGEARIDEDGWELLIERADFRMWRRPLPDHHYLCEYKCAGTYHDVSAAAFFVAQMDLEYRKEWDKAVITLDVIDNDSETNSEVVHWITRFPRPMHSREYIYVRRAEVDVERRSVALCSKAVEHPRFHSYSSTHVRVTVYSSQMVIRSHADFEEDGFDYVLTYYDDPQSPFPTPAYNYLVKYGVPGFVDKVYNAAKALGHGGKDIHPRIQRIRPYFHHSQSTTHSQNAMHVTKEETVRSEEDSEFEIVHVSAMLLD